MLMSKYGEFILLWDFTTLKDCYKGCGKKVKWEVEDVMYLLWHLIETEEYI